MQRIIAHILMGIFVISAFRQIGFLTNLSLSNAILNEKHFPIDSSSSVKSFGTSLSNLKYALTIATYFGVFFSCVISAFIFLKRKVWFVNSVILIIICLTLAISNFFRISVIKKLLSFPYKLSNYLGLKSPFLFSAITFLLIAAGVLFITEGWIFRKYYANSGN